MYLRYVMREKAISQILANWKFNVANEGLSKDETLTSKFEGNLKEIK